MRFSRLDATATGAAADRRRRTLSLNGFQTSRCRLQAKIITRNLEIFGDVSAGNIEPEHAANGIRKRQYRPLFARHHVENAAPHRLRRLSGVNLSSRDRINRHLNVFRWINGVRFFADFFSLESISTRYFI
ncbi:hypothetical protein LGM43_00655 [Burkholderia seminalis]|uniref:hypothetical protein n=1 Tax=Burkholderia seminalis TaxID=488731 RepID=UPI001CF4417A|nr:hypothetical protein [Burkholderia seminalis]MCA7948773.1 hypothetical protein [Burkholderia seminalis]